MESAKRQFKETLDLLECGGNWVACLLLFLAVLAAFVPALNNDFISFDDGTYVTQNQHVQTGLSWRGVRWAFTTSHGSNWHPLTWLSHMLDYQVYGLRPWGHHLTSIFFHGANSVLVFLLLMKMTNSSWRSLFVAGIWALHPLRVESVAWVAERKDVLSALFFLLTLWAYTTYAQRKPAAWRYYILALAFFACGLMSKPMLVTLPFVLLLLDFWPLRRLSSSPLGLLLLEKLPFLVLALLSSLVTFLVQNNAGATLLLGRLSFGDRLANAVVSYCRYLGDIFWPANLAIFYPHPGNWPAGSVLAASVLLVAITVIVFLTRRERPYLLMGWLWFLGTLVPVIGFVQVGRQAMADRYTYLPSLGVLVALTWLVPSPQAARSRATVFSAVGLALALLCGAITFHQTGFWKDSETLFRHAIAVVPDNYLAHGNLGNALEKQGRLAEALREYEEVLRLKPDDVNTRNGLGSLFLELGRTDNAIAQFDEALRRLPTFAEARSNLGYLYQRQGRLEQAALEYREALKLDPKDFRIHLNLAGVLVAQGHSQEAVAELSQAVELNPDDSSTRNDLGSVLFNLGRLDEALGEFEQAARLDSNSPEAHFNLGAALAAAGRREEAIIQLKLALKLRPNYPEATQRLNELF
ncbi:MAG TPA: tetratricopeptide repeat protein [Verrucomicrobiae bacterium]|nr:tetratricopeptide repeat protein [Verrucomicrobiae bacterium]